MKRLIKRKVVTDAEGNVVSKRVVKVTERVTDGITSTERTFVYNRSRELVQEITIEKCPGNVLKEIVNYSNGEIKSQERYHNGERYQLSVYNDGSIYKNGLIRDYLIILPPSILPEDKIGTHMYFKNNVRERSETHINGKWYVVYENGKIMTFNPEFTKIQ